VISPVSSYIALQVSQRRQSSTESLWAVELHDSLVDSNPPYLLARIVFLSCRRKGSSLDGLVAAHRPFICANDLKGGPHRPLTTKTQLSSKICNFPHRPIVGPRQPLGITKLAPSILTGMALPLPQVGMCMYHLCMPQFHCLSFRSRRIERILTCYSTFLQA
jgi:hypothetical protein